MSQDPKFIEAYQNREDLHSFTAKELFDLDCPVSEVKERHPEIRATAKQFNFAMVYEAGIDTLAQNAGIKRSEAKAARSKYFARFRGIKNFINWSHQKARTDGYIRTITGRKRHLEPATITNPKNRYEHMMQGKYERKAVNSQVQGSAADVMALGMRDLSNALKKKGMREQVNFVLQVHDEIVLELPDDEEFERELEKIVKEELEDVVDLRVPIEIDYAVADSWDKAK